MSGAPPLTPLAAPPAAAPLRVEPFTGTRAEWDAFVAAQPGGTNFHRLGWLDVIGRAYGHRRHALVARDAAGAIAGVLPLVHVESPVFGRFLVSMPFVNYGGPLGSGAAVRALADAARDAGRRRKAGLVELRSAVPLPIDWPVSHRKVTVMLDLEADEATLFKRLDSKLRSQVRRPQKEGVTVEIGPERLGHFYAVFAEHMRDLGTPVMPYRFFESALREFPDDTLVAVAYLDGAPIACGMGFRHGEEFEITWASALVAHKKIAANMLVYWELMRRCIALGVRRFNFGRTTPGSGTHKFKLQWGGYDVPLHWYQHSERGEAKTPSPDDSAYSWGPRLWKHLPISVANVLGPRIVKYIP
jgi:FemAB-related protein (PEP-CTERM system-associated)